MPNPIAAWWISRAPAAAARRGAPALAKRAPPAAWPAPDRAAPDASVVRLAGDPCPAAARQFAPVGAEHVRDSDRDPPTAAIRNSRTRDSSVAGWCW